jgi:hypothetical protein
MPVEGFWTVQFQGVQGAGGGVAVFTKGRIFGGDSGYTYTGTYEGDANIKARVSVQNFIAGLPNVMGRQGNFELEFTAAVNGDVMNATANMVGQPAMKLNTRLTRKANLP